jgi:hypothetical protein
MQISMMMILQGDCIVVILLYRRVGYSNLAEKLLAKSLLQAIK